MNIERKFYKTTFHVTILSEDPIHYTDIRDVIYYTEIEPYVAGPTTKDEEQINGKETVKLLNEFGSEPGTFMLREDGTCWE